MLTYDITLHYFNTCGKYFKNSHLRKLTMSEDWYYSVGVDLLHNAMNLQRPATSKDRSSFSSRPKEIGFRKFLPIDNMY